MFSVLYCVVCAQKMTHNTQDYLKIGALPHRRAHKMCETHKI